MNKKPIIGIVGRSDLASDEYPIIDVSESTRKAVIRCGGNPVLILPPQMIDYQTTQSKDIKPMTEEEKELLLEVLDMCDGIVTPGGFRWFEYDKFIVDYTIKNDKPLLGLCLGMQLMSCYNTEYSLEKNDENGLNHFQREVKYLHKVDVVDNTKLKDILSVVSLEVNSRHNYHITKTNDFIPCAYSFDGLIEAIEYPNKKFIIGVQWHVEVMTEYDELNKKLFTSFINSCKN